MKIYINLFSGSKYPHETAVKPMLLFYANPYSPEQVQDREALR